jgi:hypothetical protein
LAMPATQFCFVQLFSIRQKQKGLPVLQMAIFCAFARGQSSPPAVFASMQTLLSPQPLAQMPPLLLPEVYLQHELLLSQVAKLQIPVDTVQVVAHAPSGATSTQSARDAHLPETNIIEEKHG